MKRYPSIGLLLAVAVGSCSATERAALRQRLLGRQDEYCGNFAVSVQSAHAVTAAQDGDPPDDLLQLCAEVAEKVRLEPWFKETCYYENYELPFPPANTSMASECVALTELKEKRDAVHAEEKRLATAKKSEEIERGRDVVRGYARKNGYTEVLFDTSLLVVLDEVVAGHVSLSSIRHTAIYLDGADDSFRATQALGQRSGLYANTWNDVVLLLQKAREDVLEHAPLSAAAGIYVGIVGTKRYVTAIGGTRQAFVIEPAY